MAGLGIRKRKDGSVELMTDVPERHTFASRMVQRELEGGLMSVQVTLHTTDADYVYGLESFEVVGERDDGTPVYNFTGMECVLLKKTSKKRKKDDEEVTS